jgi:hypothetical protein
MLLSHANGIQMANLQELSTKDVEFFGRWCKFFRMHALNNLIFSN